MTRAAGTAPGSDAPPDQERVPARPRPLWRSVALPAEHGGWGLTLEPVALGLIVAPGAAGVAIGGVALLAFVARTPVKVVLVDRWRGRTLPRTRVARRVAAVELALLASLLGVAVRWAAAPFWVPLLAAVPLVGVELWFDMRSRSRRLLPELAGSVGIGSVAAGVVLAGNGSHSVAAAAWLVIAARAIASLPFVRFQLRRTKQPPPSRPAQDGAQVAAAGLALLGVAIGWLPWLAAAAVVTLGLVQVVLARVRPPKVVIVGVQQLVLGFAVVVVAGLALR